MATTTPTGTPRCPAVLAGALLLCLTCAAGADSPRRDPLENQARQILGAAGLQGGLVVHLHCGDGKLTAALRAGKSFLVQGLATRPQDVAEAREHVLKLGLYGPVSVERFDGKHLPYVDDLANLVVAEDLGGVQRREALRVLAPGGTLLVKRDGRWDATVKPVPGNTDEWTHYLHDASGNAVAHDDVVAPPRRVQWIAGPLHTRSHEHTPSIMALVSAGGRIFYIADEAPVASLLEPPRWNLVARDAYNGVLLWERPFDTWYPYLFNWGSTPASLQRRLVAAGDRVYVTLGLHAPLTALDAATGETLKVYEKTRGTEEILSHEGLLILAIRNVTAERAAGIRKIEELEGAKESPLHMRETAQPFLVKFRQVESKAQRTLLALEARTGRRLWTRTGKDVAGLRPVTLCAAGNRVLYQKGRDVVCLDLRRGNKLWSVSAAALRVVGSGCFICADGRKVAARSLESGEVLWTKRSSLCQVRDAFLINGSLWLGGFKPYQGRTSGKRGPVWGPYFATQRDLATGEILQRVEPECPGHHHRCWRNKATDRYILGGRRGVEYIDVKSGELSWNSWVRGVCRYGVMPANGLLYAPPHACGCYIAAKLDGFHALAGETEARARPAEAREPLLERGPAYLEAAWQGASAAGKQDWPTYRHDARRSGSTSSPVSAALRVKWKTAAGSGITSPTVCGKRVFVADTDVHAVVAIQGDSGDVAWRFTAGARVDSPPTIHEGRALFGCRDGSVYSLQASDGALAWRLAAAGDSRSVTVRGQVESASPVPGSVLVQDGAACFTAGRSSYLDGGIVLWRIRPRTGEVLSRTPIYSPDPVTGRQPPHSGPGYMPGALGQILTGDAKYVYLRDMVFDRRGARVAKGNPHLLTLTGFLDDSWPHRSYWIFGTRCSIATGCTRRDKRIVSGRLFAIDGESLYGYGRARVHWSNALQDGPYRLFAVRRGDDAARWTKSLPIQVRALVLADEVLFAAGPVPPGGRRKGAGKKAGAFLAAISARDGAELARYPLDAPPVLDGIAAADGRLYIACENGSVVCMEGTEGP